MNILHVVSSLNKGSGVMNNIMNYYRYIKTEYKFIFVYFSERDLNYEQEILELGGTVIKLDLKKGLRKNRKIFARIVKSEKVDIVHFHPLWSSFYFGKTSFKNGVKTVIQHSHTTEYSNKRFSAIRNKLMLRYSKKYITNYFAASSDAAKIFNEKTIVVKNLINFDRFKYDFESRNKIRSELNIDDKTILIGSIGRLSTEKNFPWLIMSIKDILLHQNYLLVIIGEGKQKNKIIKLIRKHGLQKKVIILNNKENIEQYYSAFDLFILPSVFEGFGIVALESQASKLYTIVSDSLPNEIFQSDHIVKFNTNNPDELVSKILEFSINNEREKYNINNLIMTYDSTKNSIHLSNVYRDIHKENITKEITINKSSK